MPRYHVLATRGVRALGMRTRVGLLARVRSQMCVEVIAARELLIASLALVGPYARVQSRVSYQHVASGTTFNKKKSTSKQKQNKQLHDKFLDTYLTMICTQDRSNRAGG